VVPPGRYFVLGDNRDNSEDSRYWGFVRRDQIRGRPWRVYYSFAGTVSESMPWLKQVRWGRIGTAIR
jgi:signal peptidase I